MLTSWFCYPILLICLWNLVPGVVDFSYSGAYQGSIQQDIFAETSPSGEFPCEQKCNNENCSGHSCHFGHCKCFALNSKLALIHPVLEFFYLNKTLNFESILSLPLQRPPHFSSAAA